MTAQRRSWMRRSRRARYRGVAGLVATLGGALSLTAVAQPALAVNPMADLSVVAPPLFQQGDTHNVVAKLDNMSTGLGDSIAISLTISNASEVGTNDFAVAKVTIGTAYCPNPSNDGFTCTFPYDGSPNLTITYTIRNNTDNAPTGGATVFDTSLIAVNDLTFVTTTNSLSQSFTLTLRGPPPATTISGETDDVTTGKPVPGAVVSLHDSAQPAHSYSTRTDSRGKFSFPVDAAHPVVAGQVFASATKSGYKTRSGHPMAFTPGTPISGWKLLVTPIVAATPTASRTPSASPTAPSSGAQAAISDVPGGVGFGPVSGGAAVLASSKGSGSNLFNYVLIGGLILILTATAILVTILIRRRRRDDDGGDDGGGSGGYSPPGYDAAYPPAGGGYGQGGGLPRTKSYPTSPYSYDDVGRS